MKKMIKVDFPNLNKSIEVEEGTKLSEACAVAGYPLNLVCGGRGKCKKCGVDIEENGEIKRVLSCQVEAYDGVRVMLKEEEQKVQILTSSTLDNTVNDPSLHVLHFTKDQLATELGDNNWDTLKKLTDNKIQKPSLEILKRLSHNYHHPKGIKLVMDHCEILDVLPGDDDKKIYGIAFDLGTTSAVGYLYEMESGELVGVSSTMNKQTELGGDVITRINHVIMDKSYGERLQKLAIDTLNEIIEDICGTHKIATDDIYMGVIVGNSTMQHLILGLYPEFLGMKPFTSTTHHLFETAAKELGLKINPLGRTTTLPLLGGFVGADTTAVLLSIPNDNKVRLMLDLGTNGEIAVGKNTTYNVSSTACGPALEGAGLSHGMRGTHGAIERVLIQDGKLSYKVIGNVKPEGICGSGVIDLVAELFKNEVINEMGTFNAIDEIDSEDLKKRVRKEGVENVFVIAFADETENGQEIYFSQNDIRQVQMAKGAIYTGCVMVVEDYGIPGEDLEEIVIAGAFGNYIDVKHAQSIGMIPDYNGVPVRSLGNAAGTGSQMYLISKEKQQECRKLGYEAVFVELANKPGFMDRYIGNLNFENLLEK
ncbi:ASKHA domain-containing protein [Alkalibacter mobilis]|uniref:ASKHA domain-containing protein n=1 Tax=Alkalibacter mobilis TaxID=2787712 RepID=UPI00189D8E82|nr:ASKHA domain-containing protein [Alkalibacter mobilis]MBF7097089.1 DUF4445 domain-containing protein [Alkalibacter mobilis]